MLGLWVLGLQVMQLTVSGFGSGCWGFRTSRPSRFRVQRFAFGHRACFRDRFWFRFDTK